MISNKPLLFMEAPRKAHCIRIKPLIFQAFEKVCEAHGHQRVSDVVELFMSTCIQNEALFYLLTYGKLPETQKRRRKQATSAEMSEELKNALKLKDTATLEDLQGKADRLKEKLEQLRRKRSMHQT
jgi:citrate synthase